MSLKTRVTLVTLGLLLIPTLNGECTKKPAKEPPHTWRVHV